LIRKNRTRQSLSFLHREFAREEYKLPNGLLVPHYEKIAVPVFKTLIWLEDCLPWILKERPNVKVIHLIRYPLGYAKSLYKRLYKDSDTTHFHEANRQNLSERIEKAQYLELDIPLKKTEIESLSELEVIIWNWVIGNQIIYRKGNINEGKTFVITYEQLLIDPIETIKGVYEYCQLPWSEEIENALNFTFKSSVSLATDYSSFFPQQEQEITKQIIDKSSLKNLWNNELWIELGKIKAKAKNNTISYSPY
jgi:hypothetical protein